MTRERTLRNRALATITLCGFLLPNLAAQQPPPPPPPAADSTKQDQKYQEPAEEDVPETNTPKTYAFNPLQAAKEIRVGNYYFKKGNYRAAARRFETATKWNPGEAEAWLRLGESAEKLNDAAAMRRAFEKYLELDPKGKSADSVRRKLADAGPVAKKP